MASVLNLESVEEAAEICGSASGKDATSGKLTPNEVKQILEYSKRNLLTLQIDQEQLDQLIRRESYALIDQLTISRNV